MIAAAHAHAKRNNYRSRLIKRDPTYWDTYLHKCVDMIGLFPSTAKHWKEPRFSYTPIPPDRTTLSGYFQSSRYFADVSGEIRMLFDPPASLKETVTSKHRQLLPPADGDVVVHIRRGDYLVGGNLRVHGILDERYYKRAVAAARVAIPNCRLLVFSDDLSWCRAQPWLAGSIFVDEPTDVHALWLTSTYAQYQSN
jgi:hypothetical protein